MTVKVVDASALGALLFGEPDGELIAARLRGCALVAPALLGFEMTSICLKKIRRYPASREVFLAAFEFLNRMAIEINDVDLVAVLRLAEDVGLTSYDASYLWLSHHLDAELVTLDQKLEAAT